MSDKRDPFDGDYIGNIFGRKLTIYGAILILFFTGIAVYRHWKLDVPFGMEESTPLPTDPIRPDSINLEEQ
jgi:hypothetical protein